MPKYSFENVNTNINNFEIRVHIYHTIRTLYYESLPKKFTKYNQNAYSTNS